MPFAVNPLLWRLHRPPEHLLSLPGTCPDPVPFDDSSLIDRISDAYKLSAKTEFGINFWTEDFAPINKKIHDALLNGDKRELAQMLRNPHTNMLFHGFEMVHKEVYSYHPAFFAHQSTLIYDLLVTFCEAIGALRIEQPETYRAEPMTPRPVEELLQLLDAALGIHIEFMNPYPQEVGLATTRGVASFRAVQSLYQGYRISKLAAEIGGPVVEIGGGLGRTAYYSAKLGVKDYTIVDIPLTAAAQSYYLGRTCGPENIRLFGEAHKAKFNMIPPDEFFSDDRFYGLIVNIDSMPEISDEMTSRYLGHIAGHTTRFLSINHEVLSPRTVRTIAIEAGGKSLGRNPYWLRRGYVDELFGF